VDAETKAAINCAMNEAFSDKMGDVCSVKSRNQCSPGAKGLAYVNRNVGNNAQNRRGSLASDVL
jgi:hypothetical protein